MVYQQSLYHVRKMLIRITRESRCRESRVIMRDRDEISLMFAALIHIKISFSYSCNKMKWKYENVE